MTDKKVKFYKNPDRNKPEQYSTYVPGYKQIGIEPLPHKPVVSEVYSGMKPARGSNDNPRAARPFIRQQPYAETIPTSVEGNKGPFPNVGNNMEQSWSGVDEEIIDDISNNVVDSNRPMIDNNNYVTSTALGLSSEIDETSNSNQFLTEKEEKFFSNLEQNPPNKEDFLSSIFQSLEEDEYILVINNKITCAGVLLNVQEEVRRLLLDENNSVSIDDIVVLKRIKIKVGVFLE